MKKIIVLFVILIIGCSSDVMLPKLIKYELRYFCVFGGQPFPTVTIREEGNIKCYQSSQPLELVDNYPNTFILLYARGTINVYINNEKYIINYTEKDFEQWRLE